MKDALRRLGPCARLASVLVVLAAYLGLVAGAVAAPGDLDPSFSGDGKVERGSNNGWMLEEPDFSDLTVQATGRIVTAGDSGLVRFNSDGTSDGSFPTESDPPSLAAVTLQDDGKILATGHAGHFYASEKEDFLVARYGPNGVPDATFAGDGAATLDFAAQEDQSKALAVQPDGKIVVAGYSVGLDSEDVPSKDFGLARYGADGTLDSGFSGDGTRTTNFGGDDVAYDVALQPDGRILVAGSSGGDFALARYEPDGRLDQTFSGDGKVTVRSGDQPGAGARALVLRGNGKIVAAGGVGKFGLVGFDSDGSLDSGFGGDGVVTTPFADGDGYPRGASASDLVLIDGRLLAAGRAGEDFGLARYRLGGHLDADFSGDGKLRTDLGPFQDDAAAAIALQEDGKVVVGGTSTYYVGGEEPWGDGAIARYLWTEGPADADADGVGDRIDRCPQVFTPQERDGCPRYARSITLDIEEAAFDGYVDSETLRCGDESRVIIYRVRRHRRTVVARATAYYDPHYGETEYYAEAHIGRGRYYAKVERQLRPGVGWCGAARSEAVKVR